MRRLLFAAVMITALSAALARPAYAQDPAQQPSAIALRGGYTATDRAAVAVRNFVGAATNPATLDTMATIIRRDLSFSDRFQMLSTPSTLQAGAIDYAAWNALRTWFLVTANVVPASNGYELELTLHDVVYSRVKVTTRYRIPSDGAPDFRMALHAIADEIVKSITNQPGSAATRIAFNRQNKAMTANATGTFDLLIVDYDGFGMKRLGGASGQIYSPEWSPDGRKLIYMQGSPAGQQVVERDIQSGATRVISNAGLSTTPAYSPDGSRIAFSAWQEQGRNSNAEIFEYQGGRVRRLTNSAKADQSPTYSPDGSQIAFMSSRLGLPHIYVMPSNGGNATQLTPYVAGMNGYYFGPDWSPTGSKIAFAGHWNSRGTYQILIADAQRAGGQIRQLAAAGDNEDPSWAPDGRHIVFSSGVGDQQLSLYVIDEVTETKRKLVDGGKLRMSDWSPPLARASDYVVR
ncbi:MAG: hypothetical protein ABIV28_07925 [Longimicrobiales bacterium]